MSLGCSKADNNVNFPKHSLPVQSVPAVVLCALQDPLEMRCHIFWLRTRSSKEEEDALSSPYVEVMSRVTLL